MAKREPFEIPDASLHIGDALVREGLLTPLRLAEALTLQSAWGTRLGDIVLAKGWVRACDFYRTLSVQFDLPYVDLLKLPPEERLFSLADIDHYTQTLYLPWKKERGELWIAVADPSKVCLNALINRYGKNVRFAITSKFDIIWNVQRYANERLTDKSVLELSLIHI